MRQLTICSHDVKDNLGDIYQLPKGNGIDETGDRPTNLCLMRGVLKKVYKKWRKRLPTFLAENSWKISVIKSAQSDSPLDLNSMNKELRTVSLSRHHKEETLNWKIIKVKGMAMVGSWNKGVGDDSLGCLWLDTLSLEWKMKTHENLEATW